MVKESVVICISGMAGSGKSTLAKRLAKKYRLKYHSGGDALKAIAIENGYRPLEHGWWESKEGMRFLEDRSKDPKFDEKADKKLLELARQGSIVLDSWTMPWLFEEGFKIWLQASLEKRVQRIAGRDGISVREASKALKSKEEKTKTIYKKLYGFSLGEDFAPFDLILATDYVNQKEVFDISCMVIENVVLKSSRIR
jgi:cytidylate kinase